MKSKNPADKNKRDKLSPFCGEIQNILPVLGGFWK
jgi:hypothetical protein